MIKHYRNETIFGHLFWITITYVAAHWFLLVATGRWWDDWVYANKNWDYLFEVMIQSSLPLSAVADGSNWLFPDGFYRVLVFAWYYVSTVLFYKILKKMDFFSKDACFWITMLFVTTPVFDARILWIMYPYAIGMPLFLSGFYLTICNENIRTKEGIIKRIISLLLLMLSYCFLQSAMLFAIPLVLYLCYLEMKNNWNWNNVKNNIIRFLKAILHYSDFLIEPIVWYFGDKILFPGYGMYGEVYYINWSDLPSIIKDSPKNACVSLSRIVITYFNVVKSSDLALCVVLLAIGVYTVKTLIDVKNHKVLDSSSNSFVMDFLMTLLGFSVFFLALFPYVVKRDSAIKNTYIDGRDSVLFGIGMAIFLYYGLYTVLRGNIPKLVMNLLIMLGVLHFNYIYLDWQESYYQQVQLQHEIAQNAEIRDHDTFLIMYRGGLICSNFYQTNGNSWAATGEETRYYIPGTDSLSDFIEMTDDTWFLNAYGMKEYKIGEKIIDGIIFVDYSDIGKRTLVMQKYNEIFHKDTFDAWIDEIKDIKYVPITKEESDKLLELYTDGELHDEIIYDMYY